jgi:hypothetical protein
MNGYTSSFGLLTQESSHTVFDFTVDPNAHKHTNTTLILSHNCTTGSDESRNQYAHQELKTIFCPVWPSILNHRACALSKHGLMSKQTQSCLAPGQRRCLRLRPLPAVV